jgi:cobalt-zinc-cadmium efflux system outer membrane protein
MVAIGTLGAGCQRYAPMPLSPDAIQKAQLNPSQERVRVAAAQMHHPILQPVDVDFDRGLSPEGVAVVAVILNPSLRAERVRRDLGAAQLLQAGLLPNPQLTYNFGLVTGGRAKGTVNPWDIGASWDISALITRNARIAAATAESKSVDLDIAWAEWQLAESAKTAVYDLIALREQLEQSQDLDQRLAENARVTRDAVSRNEKVILDLAVAESASQDAHAIVLALQQQLAHQRLMLRKLIGVDPDIDVKLAGDIRTPARVQIPSTEELTAHLEERRLDLVALRKGYESQEQTLRAAILTQFPKINVGFVHGKDNTAVVSDGFGITIDLPIFDRNQGGIATEKATRQQLFDEYISRLRDAKFDVAMAVDDIASLNNQVADAEAAIPGLERLVSTYRNAVSRGNADVLSSYTAQSNLAQKRLSVLKLKQQLVESLLTLEIASGTFLPQEDISPSTQPGGTLSPTTAPAPSTGNEATP